MKKLPKKVLIYGQWWKVVINQLRDDLEGECDYKNQTIYINTDLSKKEQHAAFFHEFIHASLYRCGMFQALSHRENEAISEAICVALLENAKISWNDK